MRKYKRLSDSYRFPGFKPLEEIDGIFGDSKAIIIRLKRVEKKQYAQEVIVAIDYDKYKDDAKWDGLKGYLTNTNLTKEEVIAQYKQLWHIEKTFRISKTDLRIRPIFHYLKRRIEAHICISFVACVVYKEMERQLKYKKSELSPEKAIDILKTIYALSIITPYSKSYYTRLLIKNDEQEQLLNYLKLILGVPVRKSGVQLNKNTKIFTGSSMEITFS